MIRGLRNISFAALVATTLAVPTAPSAASEARFCSVMYACNYFEWNDCNPPSDCIDAFESCQDYCDGMPLIYFCSDDGNHTFGQCGCSFECQ